MVITLMRLLILRFLYALPLVEKSTASSVGFTVTSSAFLRPISLDITTSEAAATPLDISKELCLFCTVLFLPSARSLLKFTISDPDGPALLFSQESTKSELLNLGRDSIKLKPRAN